MPAKKDNSQVFAPVFADDVIRIKRYYYIHILDNNTNVTRTIVGPTVYTRQGHESCILGSQQCVSVPAQCYCIVKNPIERTLESKPVFEPAGNVRVRMGESEIRFAGDPFPLYPGEELVEVDGQAVQQLLVIPPNVGYCARCLRDFNTADGTLVRAGTKWIECGPQTYVPRIEVELLERVTAETVHPNTALKITAVANFTDRNGVARLAGQSWLVRTVGPYLRFAEESIEGIVTGIVLSNKLALHLSAKYHFTDIYGKERKAGDRWMVTYKDAAVHILDVHETEIARTHLVTLTSQQYCVLVNPADASGVNRFGERVIRRGKCSFFLNPGEELLNGVEDVLVIRKDEVLLLKALNAVAATSTERAREAGTTWPLRGPTEYIPNINVEVVERRQVIALDKNEGIYVMNVESGEVRAVIGVPYMLEENEVLWEKHLPREVEELLVCPGGSRKTSQQNHTFACTRERHRIVRFNVEHNAAVQIYDFQKGTPRIVFGPNLVMLAPHEEFTVLSLSGGKPKVPNSLQSLQLFLGPRFSSDTVIVETSDHARLQLLLSYNWYFDVNRQNPSQRSFSVPDFIGDCCKTIASRVRGAVAAEDFDSFHRNSAHIIRAAVFGLDVNGEIRRELRFTANDFVVTNIDIKSAEPTDEKTRTSLQKSVQLAIEITTKSQEAAARHGNELKDQQAKGHLERQKLLDKIEVEKAKTKWLELQARSEAVQASGQSVAEAKAKADALLIEVQSELKQAQLRAMAYKISAESELKKLQQRHAIELEYTNRQNELEVEKARCLAETEAERVKRMVDAIGRETIVAIAQAGPEMQAKLLGGLGLKGYLITDGNSPVNLFNTAQSMLAQKKP